MKNFWMQPKVIIWSLVILILGIIIFQNVEPTSIDLLFWSLPAIPKLALILASMAVGSLLTLAAFFQVKRNRNTYTPE